MLPALDSVSFHRSEKLLTLIVGVGVGVGDGSCVGAGVGVGCTGLNTGLGDGFGTALIATPLFQTSFVPDLIQVNFLPEAVAVAPTFAHLSPVFTAAKDGTVNREINKKRVRNKRERVIRQKYQRAIPNKML